MLTPLSWAQTPPVETPVTKEQAQIFYEACQQNRDERMTKETQDIFCQCSSMGYKEHMTQEDLEQLAHGKGDAPRYVLNKILIEIYPPCMEFPIRDLVFQKCIQNEFQVGEKICSCMASKMASYMSERAQGELQEILKNDPTAYDPLDSITTSESYRQKEKRVVLECIQAR